MIRALLCLSAFAYGEAYVPGVQVPAQVDRYRPLAHIATCWHPHKMMEAARLNRARRRLRGYFFGSGIILAFLYVLVAAFIVSMVGVELTRFWSTVLMAAAVLLGGTYGIVLISFTGIHIVRRVLNRQPIMDAED